jgi:glycogen debranching enzyme
MACDARTLAMVALLVTLGGACVVAAHAQTAPLPPDIPKFQIHHNPIEFSQPIRRGKYLDVAGRKAVLMGREEGLFEAWVYPMKIVRDLRLSFNVEGYSYPLDSRDLAEWVTVRPECSTITYSHPAFVVRAHLLTPLDEPGTLLLLDVDSSRKVSITVSFLIDLVPMWPAGLGGQYSYWDEGARAFVLSESLGKHSAFIGSPAATSYSAQPAHNLPDSPTQFHIDVNPEYARRNFIPIAIAGGLDRAARVRESYIGLLARAAALYDSNVSHFSHLRDDFMRLQSPDAELDRAVQWAKVALDTGFVCNPQLGCGQIAGLGLSGTSARPGFGWFFGGDTFINSFAVASIGDFATLRQELAFLRGNQRADGKMMHELSQAGAMIPWFTQYPYGYYHGDTTPMYLVALQNYLDHTGDVAFVRESLDSIRKAYQFCLSTDGDGDGLMENAKAGLAAIEVGALLDRAQTDVYLAGVSAAAHDAVAHLAEAAGDPELATRAAQTYGKASESLNGKFWNPDRKLISFALTEQGGRSDEVTIWPAFPIALGQFRPEPAKGMLETLADAGASTDWGGRMLTNASKAYDPISYNNGSVWPFMTGILAWADYRAHRPFNGFSGWKQNAQLTSVAALGFVPELLSGDFFQSLDTAVPHQLFSSSGVITPLVKGMIGYYPSVPRKVIRLEPHFPGRWDNAEIRNLKAGSGTLHLALTRHDGEVAFRLYSTGLAGFRAEFSPGFEPGAAVRRVTVNGIPVACIASSQADDVHCPVLVMLTGQDDIRYNIEPGLRILEPLETPLPGDRSSAVKVIRICFDAKSGRYTLLLQGRSGRKYSLAIQSAGKPVSVDGGTWVEQGKETRLVVEFPPGEQEYVSRTVQIAMRRNQSGI